MSAIDQRRVLTEPGDREETLTYCVEHFITLANEAIKARGAFFVALSGGSTPAVLFLRLARADTKGRVDWNKVHLFWSDERSVAPDDPDSNYKTAMTGGFGDVPKSQIHRMVAEGDIQKGAADYEQLIKDVVPGAAFDLIMLGMGDDGHTASLFPGTKALDEQKRLVVANEVPQKKTWRMTFTYPLIHKARNIAFYVLGDSKAGMVQSILEGNSKLPAGLVGTRETPAEWICDEGAARLV